MCNVTPLRLGFAEPPPPDGGRNRCRNAGACPAWVPRPSGERWLGEAETERGNPPYASNSPGNETPLAQSLGGGNAPAGMAERAAA
jgi:hypothetical protein